MMTALIYLIFCKDLDFSSGNEDELRRYFNTKVSKFSGFVSLSYDVKPKYWHTSFAGTLFLKPPAYVPKYDYQKLGLDKITATWAWSIPKREAKPNETDKIYESVEHLNRKIFDQLMTNLSWVNYAGKFHMNFSGALKIDASRLKDLKGIPEMINTTRPLLKNEDYMSFSDKYLDRLLFYINSVYQATGKLPESIEDKLDGAITIDVAREIIDNYKKLTNQAWWGDFNTVTDAAEKKVNEVYYTAFFNVASLVVSTQLAGGSDNAMPY